MIEAEFGDVIRMAQTGLPTGKTSTVTVTLSNGVKVLLILGATIWDATEAS